MRRNKKLEWYVFYQKFNDSELIYSNIFNEKIVEEILKRTKIKNKYLKIDSYDSLKKFLEIEFKYRYSSKSEYEIVATNWLATKMEQKIDVYFQIEPNLDRITEYVIRELKLDFGSDKE